MCVQARVNQANLFDSNNNPMQLNDVAGGFTYNAAGNITGAAAIKFGFYLRNDR